MSTAKRRVWGLPAGLTRRRHRWSEEGGGGTSEWVGFIYLDEPPVSSHARRSADCIDCVLCIPTRPVTAGHSLNRHFKMRSGSGSSLSRCLVEFSNKLWCQSRAEPLCFKIGRLMSRIKVKCTNAGMSQPRWARHSKLLPCRFSDELRRDAVGLSRLGFA